MMRSLVGMAFALMALVMGLGLVGSAHAQAPQPSVKKSQPTDISRFVGPDAVWVIRINVAALDLEKTTREMLRLAEAKMKELGQDPAELSKQFEPDIKEAIDFQKRFLASGASDVYVVFQAGVFDAAKVDKSVFLLVTGDKMDQAALIEVMKEFMGEDEPGRVVDGGVIFGAEGSQNVPLDKPIRKDEVDKAFKTAGAGPVQAILIPTDALRKEIEGMGADLPEELGGGPVSIVIEGVRWAAASLTPPPGGSLKLVFQSANAEAAMKFSTWLVEVVRQGAQLFADGDEKQTAKITNAVTVAARNDQVHVELLGKDFETVLTDVLITAMFTARQTARQAVGGVETRMVLQGVTMYALDHKDNFPDTLDELVKGEYLQPEVLTTSRNGVDTPRFVYRKPSAQKVVDVGMPAKEVILYEAYKEWPKAGVYVGFIDGHVWLIRSEAELKELLEFKKKPEPKK